MAEFRLDEVDSVAGDVVSLDITRTTKMLPTVAGDLESPRGPIDILSGRDHMAEAPREHERGQGLVRYI
jgi:hypothetical protein